MVYETVSFTEVISRNKRALGAVRLEAELIRLQAAKGRELDRGADRMLTLDLIGEAATALGDFFRAMPGSRCRSQVEKPRLGIERARRKNVPAKLFAAAALGLLTKNLRNVPILKPEHQPTGSQIVSSLDVCEELARVAQEAYTVACKNWGRLDLQARVAASEPVARRVVTHSRPDGDAIVSAWLAVRYLFAGEPVEVLFVPRQRVLGCFRPGDCLVDVGNTHDPKNQLYDHKPPALPARYDSCAARMVWAQLLKGGTPVKHLERLVNAVHARDSVRHRSRYREELAWSERRGGFHLELARFQKGGHDDATIFRRLSKWLDDENLKLKIASSR
jgi:hypothetical protein